MAWLLDEQGRDQFVLRHGNDTEIFWSDPVRQAGQLGRELKYGGDKQKQGGKVRRLLLVCMLMFVSVLLCRARVDVPSAKHPAACEI